MNSCHGGKRCYRAYPKLTSAGLASLAGGAIGSGPCATVTAGAAATAGDGPGVAAVLVGASPVASAGRAVTAGDVTLPPAPSLPPAPPLPRNPADPMASPLSPESLSNERPDPLNAPFV